MSKEYIIGEIGDALGIDKENRRNKIQNEAYTCLNKEHIQSTQASYFFYTLAKFLEQIRIFLYLLWYVWCKWASIYD